MDKKDLRIAFMGTPSIAASFLSYLIADGFNIVAVIAQIDKPIGRKRILEPVPTKKVALEHNIPVYQPIKIRLDYEFLREVKPDLILTMAYGQLVPKGVLEFPKYGCLNMHGSILPYYRGAAPIQRAIMNGEKETGVSLMKMVEAMDAGEVYDIEKIMISSEDNYTSLCDKMAKAAFTLVKRSLLNVVSGKLIGTLQNDKLATFANKILDEEEHLPLLASGKQIVNTVRGLSEQPGAYLLLQEQKLKIYKAEHLKKNYEGEIGQIVDTNGGLVFKIFDGAIKIDELQLEGKKKMNSKDFINGQKEILGKVLK